MLKPAKSLKKQTKNPHCLLGAGEQRISAEACVFSLLSVGYVLVLCQTASRRNCAAFWLAQLSWDKAAECLCHVSACEPPVEFIMIIIIIVIIIIINELLMRRISLCV